MENIPVDFIHYQHQYAVYFEQLNKEWIEEFYDLEPLDKYVLENPEEAIIAKGGKILFAKYKDNIIGTVALKVAGQNIYELTKMAVDKKFRGLGAGKLLCIRAVEEAKILNAKKVILYSNTRQSTAIIIYRKLGFIESPVEPGIYQRSNIKIELLLN
jgi:N-acetylglutamate synthase-like GNAT family acetyltransferase